MSEATTAEAVEPLAALPVAWREQHGLSRLAAARRLGVAHATLRHWEVTGVRPRPLQLSRPAEVLVRPVGEIRAAAGPDRVRMTRTSGGEDASPLCRARRAVGLTTTQLARKVHVGPATVSRWETGARTPTPASQTRLAAALRLTPDEIARAVHDRRPGRAGGVALPGLGALRRAHGLTQREFCSRMAIGVTTGGAWEHGRVRVPAARPPEAAAVLGCTSAEPVDTARRALAEPTRPPLAALRERAGLTQRELAHYLGMSVRSVVRRESGAAPLRQAAGQSAAALGRRLGVTGRIVRAWETGAASVTPSAAQRLEMAHGLPRGSLIRPRRAAANVGSGRRGTVRMLHRRDCELHTTREAG